MNWAGALQFSLQAETQKAPGPLAFVFQTIDFIKLAADSTSQIWVWLGSETEGFICSLELPHHAGWFLEKPARASHFLLCGNPFIWQVVWSDAEGSSPQTIPERVFLTPPWRCPSLADQIHGCPDHNVTVSWAEERPRNLSLPSIYHFYILNWQESFVCLQILPLHIYRPLYSVHNALTPHLLITNLIKLIKPRGVPNTELGRLGIQRKRDSCPCPKGTQGLVRESVMFTSNSCQDSMPNPTIEWGPRYSLFLLLALWVWWWHPFHGRGKWDPMALSGCCAHPAEGVWLVSTAFSTPACCPFSLTLSAFLNSMVPHQDDRCISADYIEILFWVDCSLQTFRKVP